MYIKTLGPVRQPNFERYRLPKKKSLSRVISCDRGAVRQPLPQSFEIEIERDFPNAAKYRSRPVFREGESLSRYCSGLLLPHASLLPPFHITFVTLYIVVSLLAIHTASK